MTEALAHAETKRLTVDDVLHMVEVGILAEDEPVELLRMDRRIAVRDLLP